MKNKSSKNVRGCSNNSSYSSSDNVYGNAKKILLIAALDCGLQLLWLYFRHFLIPDGDKDSLGPCLMWQCMIAIFSTVSYPRKKAKSMTINNNNNRNNLTIYRKKAQFLLEYYLNNVVDAFIKDEDPMLPFNSARSGCLQYSKDSEKFGNQINVKTNH
jgi:hypothetical protein